MVSSNLNLLHKFITEEFEKNKSIPTVYRLQKILEKGAEEYANKTLVIFSVNINNSDVHIFALVDYKIYEWFNVNDKCILDSLNQYSPGNTIKTYGDYYHDAILNQHEIAEFIRLGDISTDANLEEDMQEAYVERSAYGSEDEEEDDEGKEEEDDEEKEEEEEDEDEEKEEEEDDEEKEEEEEEDEEQKVESKNKKMRTK
jgi:flagellar biosynthesis GTPase FlhF